VGIGGRMTNCRAVSCGICRRHRPRPSPPWIPSETAATECSTRKRARTCRTRGTACCAGPASACGTFPPLCHADPPISSRRDHTGGLQMPSQTATVSRAVTPAIQSPSMQAVLPAAHPSSPLSQPPLASPIVPQNPSFFPMAAMGEAADEETTLSTIHACQMRGSGSRCPPPR
jgi:hypothetical protein